MKTHKLVLHPADPEAMPRSVPQLTRALRRIGFIGGRLEPRSSRGYRAGDRFLQLITFLGCSPQITLEPPADGASEFCHVVLSGPHEAICFVSGTNTTNPKCPACKRQHSSWKQTLKPGYNRMQNLVWRCPGCETLSSLADLNWHRSVGCGRFFLEIRDVFPGEAVPSDELMQTLSSATGLQWRYFYVSLNTPHGEVLA